MIKEALEYIAELKTSADNVRVVEIAGRTYADKKLIRYDDVTDMASCMVTHTLSSVIDYIASCSGEFRSNMILHVEDPKTVSLISVLDKNRERECLLKAQAIVSEFPFGVWLSQDEFMTVIQANIVDEDYMQHQFGADAQRDERSINDLAAIKLMAGNAEQKNNVQYSDDGVTQVATATIGAGSKGDVLVPNPVFLRPYRTFQEIIQPESPFVFRISDGDKIKFRLVEAGGNLWRNEAINRIKEYLIHELNRLDQSVINRITIIG